MCKDDISKIENYDKAVKDLTQMWECHHKAGVLPCGRFTRETLKKFNLYWHRPANELIFLTKKEHRHLHSSGAKLSKNTIEKIRSKLSGRKLSDEEKAKRREERIKRGTLYGLNHSTKGRKWYNNGIIQVLAFEKPEGFSHGILDSVKDKVRGTKNANFGKPMPEERRIKLSKNCGSRRQEVRDKISRTRIERRCGIGNKNAAGNKGHTGLKWITDGVNERTIPLGEMPPIGWRFGRKRKPRN